MQLYYIPGACSLASHIVAREAGLEIALNKVSFNQDGTRTTDSGENFYAVNPMGYVPALRLDDQDVLTEGPAILQYLADLAPEKQLISPAGSMERYHLIEWVTFISSEVHKTFSTFYQPQVSDEVKAQTIAKLEKRFAHIEKRLETHAFLMGDVFTIVDAYLFTIMNWRKNFGIEITAYPQLEAYLQKISQRPAVLEAMNAEGLL